jgi:nitrate reductase NapE component
MNCWPAGIEPTIDALRKRATAFRKIKSHCKHARHAPLMLCIENWTGETLDGWNAKALIFSLRHHHAQQLAAQTEQHRLKPEFYLFAILAVCLFANLGTVVFGVGCATKAMWILLDHFSEMVRLQNQNHAVLEANEEKLRRTLSEAMALEEEFNLLFSEMDALLRGMERDADFREKAS